MLLTLAFVANSCKSRVLNELTSVPPKTTIGNTRGLLATVNVGCRIGGDTASTEVYSRGMHAEHHRLVNPMEQTITADTQLAFAA